MKLNFPLNSPPFCPLCPLSSDRTCSLSPIRDILRGKVKATFLEEKKKKT